MNVNVRKVRVPTDAAKSLFICPIGHGVVLDAINANVGSPAPLVNRAVHTADSLVVCSSPKSTIDANRRAEKAAHAV
jgi:hypothetical protein